MSNFRIIDANLNRASEALRVLEEVARFCLEEPELTENFKQIRHNINTCLSSSYESLLTARDSTGDIGYNIVNSSERNSLQDVLKANFKRAQQALRVLEEYCKIENPDISGIFESARYKTYDLEKHMDIKVHKIYRKSILSNKKLYLVTDRSNFTSIDSFYDAIASAINGGVDIVQLREKTATAKEFLEIAKVVKEICHHNDVLFIINDRIDIALAVQADGIHLGHEDIDLHSARHMLGHQAIIGNSTHKPEDALQAIENGADYIGVGPVFTTPTKPGRQAVGFEYVQWAAQNVTIPFFAIGGINETNVQDVVRAGASRVAVVRAIINAQSPKNIATTIKDSLSSICERQNV